MEETNWFMSLISNPFAKGLAIGLVFCVIIYIRGFLRRTELSKEVNRLRAHLHTKLEIDSSENERRKGELDRLKQERDNLRITVQSLNQKPGRKEIRQYFIYQTALDVLIANGVVAEDDGARHGRPREDGRRHCTPQD